MKETYLIYNQMSSSSFEELDRKKSLYCQAGRPGDSYLAIGNGASASLL